MCKTSVPFNLIYKIISLTANLEVVGSILIQDKCLCDLYLYICTKIT